MKVKIQKGTARGYVDAPPSKSMAHRMLICAGLSEGTSQIRGIAESEDILATLDCLKSIGAKYQKQDDCVTITGVDLKQIKPKTKLNCRESGSTLRFFIPLCLISGEEAVFQGSERLMERPLNIYEKICAEKGIAFQRENNEIKVKGMLQSGVYSMAGNISSQFVSGLMFVLPLLEGDSEIRLIPPVESRSYIDMTIDALKTFGVNVVWKDLNTLAIRGNQKYCWKAVSVEGDYSNAAFLDALNLFEGQVEVGNLKNDSIQGDKVYGEMFKSLDRSHAELNISDCPDLGPILFAVAAAKNGGVFSGTARLRIKESDRALVMAEELKKFGVEVTVGEDVVKVDEKGFKAPVANLNGHNDHRIVMSMAVLSSLTGGVIEGAEAVKKSFPDFFDKIRKLGIEVEIVED